MATNDPELVQQALERQESTPAALEVVSRTVDQHPVLVGIAIVAVLAYAVYHLVGSKSSEKEGSSAGFAEPPSNRGRAGDAEAGGEGE